MNCNSPKPLKEEDVKKLMDFARCDQEEATRALYNNNLDVFLALQSLYNKDDSENNTPLLAIIPTGYPIILEKPQTTVVP